MGKRLLAVCMLSCWFAALAAAQALQTQIVPVDCWTGHSGCYVRSGRDGSMTQDWAIADDFTRHRCEIPGAIPRGATVYEVTASVYAADSNPFDGITASVGLTINGVTIGTTQSVSTVASHCDGTDRLGTYEFSSGFSANGLPWFNTDGTPNVVELAFLAGEALLEAVDLEIKYALPPPAEFAITSAAPEEARRVLISNVRTSYPYPHFQSIGSRDAEVTTHLRVRDANGNFESGVTVYLRIVDPPDSAPYMNLSGNVIAHDDDNEGADAILDGPGVALHSPGVYQATSGANGLVDFTLRLQPPYVAGDNYQIEASRDALFPSGATARSGILTAWKRVFIEKRRMLKNGLFLAQDAMAGDNFIVTRGNRWGGNRSGHDELSKNEKIVITHAPQRDGSDLNQGWYYETHTILSVEDLGNGTYTVNLGRKQGNTIIVEQLQHDYRVESTDQSIGDGISKLDTLTLGPGDYFDASPGLVTGEAFLEAFTQNIYLPDTTTPGAMVPVPFLETNTELELQNLAEKWSSVVVNGMLLPNHQLLIIAADNGSGAARGTDSGVAISQVAGRTSSWVFRGTIEQVLRGGSNSVVTGDRWAMKTSAHEIAHQWRANRAWNLTDHCPDTTTMYDDPALYCLLAENHPDRAETQRANGIARFHMLRLTSDVWHSEYLGIRRRPDPFVP